MQTATKIGQYIRKWKAQGYPDDIPDEVPQVLANQNLAPSYKAICIALLRNDHNLESLGFSPKKSHWYSAIKRVELAERARLKALNNGTT
jgi:predicted phosphoadenosine phosphosulfate sulfurtransferase